MLGQSVVCQNNAERIFNIVCNLLGACLTAVMFGQMAQLLSGLDRDSIRYDLLKSEVGDQISHLPLLSDTRERIEAYYEFQWRVNSGMDRSAFLKGLSPCLRNEVLLSLYADIIMKIPFFNGPNSSDFVCLIVERLSTLFFLPSDIVVHEGEMTTPSSCMYFITVGTVAVYKSAAPEVILRKMAQGK